MKVKNRFYNNPNGLLTTKEIVRLKYEGKEQEWMRNFRVTDNKCPPDELRQGNCFYCIKCWIEAFKQIDIGKRQIKIRGRKYKLKDFDI